MRSLLGLGTAVLAACLALCGASALLAQDEGRGAPTVEPAKALQPGDTVDVVVTTRARVAADGSITVSGLGRVDATGKTADEVVEVFSKHAAEAGARCEVRPNPAPAAFVTGGVRCTVELPRDGSMRLRELLAKAGLPGSADINRVNVRRTDSNGRVFDIAVDVDDVLLRNQDESNIVVRDGDLVVVPTLEGARPASKDHVFVLGEVGSPGRRPLVEGRTPFTLTKLLAMCGDLRDGADRAHVTIIRGSESTRHKMEVDLGAIIEGRTPDVELQPDDVVYVPHK